MAKRALVAYYSRTGTTRKVAEAIAGMLQCDVEEVVDTKDRAGVGGFLQSGKDAMLKKLTVIREPAKSPRDYDLVIIGTPVWAWTMATPVRTYISRYADQFKAVAFFLTTGGTGIQRTLQHMEELCGKKPQAVLGLKMDKVLKADPTPQIKAFVDALNA
jgi:flavodoxin